MPKKKFKGGNTGRKGGKVKNLETIIPRGHSKGAQLVRTHEDENRRKQNKKVKRVGHLGHKRLTVLLYNPLKNKP